MTSIHSLHFFVSGFFSLWPSICPHGSSRAPWRLRVGWGRPVHGTDDAPGLVVRLHHRSRHHATLGHACQREGKDQIRRTQGKTHVLLPPPRSEMVQTQWYSIRQIGQPLHTKCPGLNFVYFSYTGGSSCLPNFRSRLICFLLSPRTRLTGWLKRRSNLSHRYRKINKVKTGTRRM